MEDNHEIYDIEEPTKSKALPLFIFLFLASLALCAFLFFRYVKNASAIEEKNTELTLAYKILNIKSDSLESELEYVNQQLQDKINENLANQDLKEDLRQKLEQKKAELSSAYRRIKQLVKNGSNEAASGSNPTSLLQAKSEIKSLQDQNNLYIAKVEEAQRQYSEAMKLANANKSNATIYRIENDSLIAVNTDLSEKLGKAGILRIAGLAASPVRERRGSPELTSKASKTERIKLNFSVLASEIIKKEKKNIKIKITQPNGSVLTKDTKKLTDSDELFSLEESINFDGTEKGVTMYYDQEAKFQKGNHKVEIYHEDKLLDRTSFSLR